MLRDYQRVHQKSLEAGQGHVADVPGQAFADRYIRHYRVLTSKFPSCGLIYNICYKQALSLEMKALPNKVRCVFNENCGSVKARCPSTSSVRLNVPSMSRCCRYEKKKPKHAFAKTLLDRVLRVKNDDSETSLPQIEGGHGCKENVVDYSIGSLQEIYMSYV